MRKNALEIESHLKEANENIKRLELEKQVSSFFSFGLAFGSAYGRRGAKI